MHVGESFWRDRGHVGDGSTGTCKVQVVDQHVCVGAIDGVEDGEGLRQVAHGHEGHELEAAPDVASCGGVAQFAESLGESGIADAA